MPDIHELHDRWIRVLNDRNWSDLASIVTDDYHEDWPQSGERVVGLENFRRIFENYPGQREGALTQSSRVFGNKDRWAITPMFTTIRVSGDEDVFTSMSEAIYPDGSKWYIVAVVEMREGRMAKATRLWAPAYPAPEWRAAWVESIPGDTAGSA